MNSDDFARDIIKKYKEDQNIGQILKSLEKETLKGPKEGLINLASDIESGPNVRPWNWLGIYLIQNNNLDDSKQLWENMIRVAHETACEHYKGIAHVGTPWNNLAVTFERMRKTADALIAIKAAYEYDLLIGNPYGNARQNFINLLNKFSQQELFGDKLSIKKKDERKINLYEKIPKYIRIAIFLQFLLFWVIGVYIYFKGFNNWLFLVPIISGSILLLAPYLNLKISTPFGGFASEHPKIEGHDGYLQSCRP